MLKKLFFVGLGISIIAVKKSVTLLRESKERMGERGVEDTPVEEAAAEVVDAVEAAAEETAAAPDRGGILAEADDLTAISGIGPTYAGRLVDSGITTFEVLSRMSPEELREVTKAKGKTADPESWIAQAGSLA